MKLYYFKDETKRLCYLGTDKQIEIPDNYTQKPVRGLWVSNVLNIDLPVIEDIQTYKNHVITMLDTCLSYNINTIYFQVRTTNDAFYESKLNPYSRYLTGQEGKKPEFDVLNWIIKETKKRSIEFHAWCNPYRLSVDGKLSLEDYLQTCDDLNFAKRNKDVIIADQNGKLILNPAKLKVQKFIIDSMKELATNYDIDGIHFDDYFYPYSGLHKELNDLLDYEHRDKKDLSLADFRRNNVSAVIQGVHDMLKDLNPKIRFGVSPFGIWKNKSSDPLGSNTGSACSESFSGQFADSYKWVKEEMVDYIVPQIYWEFGHKIAPFADICDWWVDLCRDTKVDLYIGHAAYRLGDDNEFANPYELVNQVKYTNQFQEVKGNIFFTYSTFIDKEKSKEGMIKLKMLLSEV